MSRGAAGLALAALGTLASCSSTGGPTFDDAPPVLQTKLVRVVADFDRRGTKWRFAGARASAKAALGIVALRVSLFEDLDGDGRASEGEPSNGWFARPGSPASVLAVSGQTLWRRAEDEEQLRRMHLSVEVEYPDGGVDRRTAALFE